ncbi:methyl-accepting chemotaxis protein [Geotalea sp. SG265]|uniref:methyl-accepting chemotaxis protein n=1 Tax=Geotalea sp. SG265 TaxID=2922867 RepID=UPI001FAF0D4C|nr:methyl-accepting chemotaxis protein [Geotalea sp. SG265]
MEIAGATEEEFLATGANLHDFYGRAGQISEKSSEMAGQVSGEEISRTIQRLQEILQQMEEYLVHGEKETEQSSKTLRSILELLDKTATPLSGFRKINKSLRMLGISTKIESARLGQSAAGFDTLANDVGQLSIQVLEKAGTILEQKDQLNTVIRQTLNQVLDLGMEQRHQVQGTLERTQTSLAALTQVNSRCSKSASAIAEASGVVSRNIGEVVMSMQFHDIVRQQIEHVAEALDDLQNSLESGTDDREDVQDLARKAAGICQLQTAQLAHARDELNNAVGRIVDNLHNIAAKQSRLSEDTRAMAGVADQTGSSFLTGLEADLTMVAAVLDQSSQLNRTLTKAMGTVAETVMEITNFVNDIEFIGEEIELIALNAQVKAALTGEEGAALGVLAEAIQRLSVDAIAQTSAVSAMLTQVTDATEGLCTSARADVTELDVEVEEMVNSLPALLQSLQGVNDSLSGCLASMRGAVQILCSDIDTATNGITAHHQVSSVIDQVMEELNAIIGEALTIAPASKGEDTLMQLADRYTMDSERKIHNSIMQKDEGAMEKSGSAGPPADVYVLPSGDDLGDNVELF